MAIENMKAAGDDHIGLIKSAIRPGSDAALRTEAEKNRIFRTLLDNAAALDHKPIEPSGMQRMWWTPEGVRTENISAAEARPVINRMPPFDPSAAQQLPPAPIPVGEWAQGGTIPGTAIMRQFESGSSFGEIVAKEKAAATKAEHARIMAALSDLKPRPRKLTHGDWARGWREEGAAELWAKIMKALGAAE